ncbi:MAG: sigma 54-interacting transcriptional regulator [Deferrisomatales bacterium]
MDQMAFLDSLFESAHNGIMAVDRRGTVVVFNRAAREILGLGPEPLVGKHHAEIAPAVWPEIRAVMESGVARLGQQIRIGDRVIVANRTPIRRRGEVVGLVSVFSDLAEAERVFSEFQIYKRLAHELEAIIEASYDGIYVTDGQARTLRVNRAYERISGLRREDLVGRTMQELVEAGCFDRSVTLEVLKTGSPVTIMQDIRGGKRVIVTGTPFRDPATGEIALVVTNVRDITELDELRSQLQRLKVASTFYSKELERLQTLQDMGFSLVARSPRMLGVIDAAVRVARFDTTVLVTGESGTGKGMLARLIHRMSPRKDGPFLKINCGGIPAALLESELFGYEAGSFTGANPKGKPGLLEVAHGGTVFLDEIADLPLELQVKLLHVLEDRTLNRVGGTREIPIDVRIIAAANRDLGEAVGQGAFRRDLYYRLQVVPIEVPPLRERREDVLPLAHHFLARFNERYGKRVRLAPDAADRLLAHSYPGNVRELENLVERLVVMAPADEVSLDSLPFAGLGDSREDPGAADGRSLREILDDVEKRVLRDALLRFGSTHRVARHLGINQSTVVRKLRKHRIRLDAVTHRSMR